MNQNMKHLKILDMAKNLNMLIDVSMKDSSNAESLVSSPFTLPPYNSLAPVSLPDNNNDTPPFCVYPPPNPESPSPTIPSPVQYNPTPPSPFGIVPSPTTPDFSPSPPSIVPGPPENVPNPPNYEPSPPSGDIPSPPEDVPIPSPPSIDIPSPPEDVPTPSPPSVDIPSPPEDIPTPSPPENVPSPIGYEPSPPVFEPSPPVFEPPVVYPPPTVPRSPPGGGGRGSGGSVWCVAKPSVPDPIIQEAMNYACGSGADCGPLQPNGQCYEPNTLLAHASYAFNSYWQRTKAAGATCSFGGTAILVTVNPSSQGCHFVSY
ncbi:hypothetical protein SOVF_139710 [Spinacia oleracea]|nr:hypothetical protein SOVF_139710 [Spinacia oleracea]